MTGKEIYNVPTSATNIKAVDMNGQEMIQFNKGEVKSTWNIKLYYLTCSGNSAKAKNIRRKLTKLQGKPPKDTVKYGTKKQHIKEMEKSFEKENKKAKRQKPKQQDKIISRKEIIESFKSADSVTRLSIYKELTQHL